MKLCFNIDYLLHQIVNSRFCKSDVFFLIKKKHYLWMNIGKFLQFFIINIYIVFIDIFNIDRH